MADVLATVEIFQQMLILLKKKGIEDKAKIIEFQNYALWKCM
jgi:hypothetical protein